MNRYRITLTCDHLDLLDDILAYYRLSDFGGGDHRGPDDRQLFADIEQKVTQQMERAEREAVS